MFNFQALVSKYSAPVIIEEETGGDYDYDNGGKWKPETVTREIMAAIFNLTARDINSAIRYNDGGSYTKDDIKVYLHESLAIGSKITHKGKKYTVSSELDYGDHANGLRIYIAKGAGQIKYADAEE